MSYRSDIVIFTNSNRKGFITFLKFGGIKHNRTWSSFYGYTYICQILLWYISYLLSYNPDNKKQQTDRRNDRPTDKLTPIYPTPLDLVCGVMISVCFFCNIHHSSLYCNNHWHLHGNGCILNHTTRNASLSHGRRIAC